MTSDLCVATIVIETLGLLPQTISTEGEVSRLRASASIAAAEGLAKEEW